MHVLRIRKQKRKVLELSREMMFDWNHTAAPGGEEQILVFRVGFLKEKIPGIYFQAEASPAGLASPICILS